MSNLLQNLPKTSSSLRKRVGRGIGSGKGKTSGRGVKGQKSRTGHHSVKGFEGGQTPIHMILPKRGFNSLKKNKIETVNIDAISRLIKSKKIEENKEINKELLKSVGLIKGDKSQVKLISGKFDTEIKGLKVLVDTYSQSAKKYS
jgi:large subunit ribosomal protein L15